MLSSTDDKILVGRISGLFGVRGWLKLFSYSRPHENLLSYNPLWLKKDTGWVAMQIEDKQSHADGRLIVKFAGIDDRDIARDMIGLDLGIAPEQLPEREEGDYYWVDLIGCTVKTLADVEIGLVVDMMETGAHDVMRVKTKDGIELIPFAQGVIVQRVDLGQKLIVIDWEAGYH